MIGVHQNRSGHLVMDTPDNRMAPDIDNVPARPQRRRHSPAFKQRVIAEALAGKESVSVIARRHDINANLLFKWKRLHLAKRTGSVEQTNPLVPIDGSRSTATYPALFCKRHWKSWPDDRFACRHPGLAGCRGDGHAQGFRQRFVNGRGNAQPARDGQLFDPSRQHHAGAGDGVIGQQRIAPQFEHPPRKLPYRFPKEIERFPNTRVGEMFVLLNQLSGFSYISVQNDRKFAGSTILCHRKLRGFL